MTRRYLGGELNELALRRLRAAASRRHAAAAARPMVEERYRKVEAWMLERYADHGVVERVLDEAERMQRDDPDAWHRIAGWPLVRGTLRKYWHRIDSRRQQQAYAEFARRRRARS
jgi:hypothetical protein